MAATRMATHTGTPHMVTATRRTDTTVIGTGPTMAAITTSPPTDNTPATGKGTTMAGDMSSAIITEAGITIIRTISHGQVFILGLLTEAV